MTYTVLLSICTFDFSKLLKYSENWKGVFLNLHVEKQLITALCKDWDKSSELRWPLPWVKLMRRCRELNLWVILVVEIVGQIRESFSVNKGL